VRREVIQPLMQCAAQIVKTLHADIRQLLQRLDPRQEGFRFDIKRFVRTPARQHFNAEAGIVCQRAVMAQVIQRIVSGAHHLHLHLLHDAARGKAILRQQFIAAMPDAVSRFLRKQRIGNTERPA